MSTNPDDNKNSEEEFLPVADLDVDTSTSAPKRDVSTIPKKKIRVKKKKKSQKPKPSEEKKPLPLWIAWLITVGLTSAIIFFFSLTALYEDPILIQIEILLVLFLLSLPGILTGSKLRALLSFPTVLLLYFLFYIFKLRFPFGSFGSLLGNNGVLQAHTGELSQLLALELADFPLELIGWMLDIFFMLIIIPLTAIYLTSLITSFRSSEPKKNIWFVSKTIFSVILLLLLILTVPFAYIGVAKFSEGTTYLGVAVSEVVDSTGLDIENMDVNQLMNNKTFVTSMITALEQANINILNAIHSYDFVEQNFFILLLLSLMGYEDLIDLFKAADGLSYFIEGSPGILLGLYSLNIGLNSTFNALPDYIAPNNDTAFLPMSLPMRTKMTAEYSPSFEQGLNYIQMAVNNFTAAQTPIQDSLTLFEEVFAIESLNDMGIPVTELSSSVHGLNSGLPLLLELGTVLVDITNSTYLSILAINSLSENDFNEAQAWMDESEVRLSEVINRLELNASTTNFEPINNVITAFNGITETLEHFIKGGSAGVNTYITLNSTLSRLENVNASVSPNTDPTNDALWNDVSEGIDEGQAYFENLTTQMELANQTAVNYSNTSFGDLTDIFVPIFELLATTTNDFYSNMNDANMILNSIENTFDAYYNLSYGCGLFLDFINANPAPNYYPNNFTESLLYVTTANQSATYAYDNLTYCDIISNSTRVTWQNILYSDDNDTSNDIISLCLTVIDTIETIEGTDPAVAVETVVTVLQDLEKLSIGDVF